MPSVWSLEKCSLSHESFPLKTSLVLINSVNLLNETDLVRKFHNINKWSNNSNLPITSRPPLFPIKEWSCSEPEDKPDF